MASKNILIASGPRDIKPRHCNTLFLLRRIKSVQSHFFSFLGIPLSAHFHFIKSVLILQTMLAQQFAARFELEFVSLISKTFSLLANFTLYTKSFYKFILSGLMKMLKWCQRDTFDS